MPPDLARPAARAAFALALAAMFLGVTPGPRAFAQGSDLPEELRTIADVRFRGLHKLGKREMAAAALRTRRPSRLPWRERPALRRDYLRADSAAIVGLYRHYGYLDAAVNVRLVSAKDPRSAIVVFDVREGALTRVGDLVLDGVSVFPKPELQRAVLAQPGHAYDPAFLQLDAIKLRSLYQERGYDAGVDTSARRGVPDSVHVRVRYALREGPQYRIGRIEYLHGPKVRESLGRRELLLKPGDVFRRSRLDRSVERLYDTGLFRQVQVSTVPDSSKGTLDLLLRVSERSSRWVDLGIGSGTSDRLRTTAEWGHRNLDTRALMGVVDGEVGWYADGRPHKTAAAFTVTEPWLFGVRVLGQAGLFYRELHNEGYNTGGDLIYTQHTDARGYSFSLVHEFSRMARLTLLEEDALIHQHYTVEASALLADTTIQRLDSLTIKRYRTNTLRATMERDTRNDRVTPTRGSYQTLVLEQAGGWLKGQTKYRKVILSSVWYTPRRNGWQLAARAMGGVMGPFGETPENFTPDLGVDPQVSRVPRESRFFIGGVNSMRGYGENALPQNDVPGTLPSGGMFMGLGNLELRVPVVGPFGFEFFLDAGNVWARPEYIRAKDFVLPWQATRQRAGDVRYTYGVGARLVLPFGPLRIDLARADRPDFPFPTVNHQKLPFVYQFAIGPSF